MHFVQLTGLLCKHIHRWQTAYSSLSRSISFSLLQLFYNTSFHLIDSYLKIRLFVASRDRRNVDRCRLMHCGKEQLGDAQAAPVLSAWFNVCFFFDSVPYISWEGRRRTHAVHLALKLL